MLFLCHISVQHSDTVYGSGGPLLPVEWSVKLFEVWTWTETIKLPCDGSRKHGVCLEPVKHSSSSAEIASVKTTVGKWLLLTNLTDCNCKKKFCVQPQVDPRLLHSLAVRPQTCVCLLRLLPLCPSYKVLATSPVHPVVIPVYVTVWHYQLNPPQKPTPQLLHQPQLAAIPAVSGRVWFLLHLDSFSSPFARTRWCKHLWSHLETSRPFGFELTLTSQIEKIKH